MIGCLQFSEESVHLGIDILNGLFQFQVWCNPNNLVSFPDDIEMFCCRPAICEEFTVSDQFKTFWRVTKNLDVEVLLRGQSFSLGAQVPKRLPLIFRRRSQLVQLILSFTLLIDGLLELGKLTSQLLMLI